MATKNPADGPAPAKVLIVDDHPVVREGLAMHLAAQPDLEVCGEAEDVPGALALLASTRPDVAIIDISLPNGNGLDLVRRIAEHHPGVRVLVWSMYPEHLYAERALRAGAHGYLNKGQATQHVLDAVRAILQGKVHVSGGLADQLLRRMVGHKPDAALAHRQSVRQGTRGVPTDRRRPDDRGDCRQDARQPQDRGNLPGPDQGETGAVQHDPVDPAGRSVGPGGSVTLAGQGSVAPRPSTVSGRKPDG